MGGGKQQLMVNDRNQLMVDDEDNKNFIARFELLIYYLADFLFIHNCERK